MASMAKLFSTRVFNGEKTIFSTNTAGNTRYHMQKKIKKKKKWSWTFTQHQRQMAQTPQFNT